MAKSVKVRSESTSGNGRQKKKALDKLRGVVGGERRDAKVRLLHHRVRLGMVSALAVSGSMSFAELKGALKLTDGNLSAHARKLEDAGLLECTKSFSGRTPRTTYKLVPAGKDALEKYLSHMESLIAATRGPGEDRE